MIVAIIVGSTIKGLVTGVAMGVLARRVRSVPVGIVGGLAVGLALSYLAALTPDPQGQHHYAEIMLPQAATPTTASVRWVHEDDGTIAYFSPGYDPNVNAAYAGRPRWRRREADPVDMWSDWPPTNEDEFDTRKQAAE